MRIRDLEDHIGSILFANSQTGGHTYVYTHKSTILAYVPWRYGRARLSLSHDVRARGAAVAGERGTAATLRIGSKGGKPVTNRRVCVRHTTLDRNSLQYTPIQDIHSLASDSAPPS